MCGGVHYGEVEGLVSVERWSCSRGASCVVEYTIGGGRSGLLKRLSVCDVHVCIQSRLSWHAGTGSEGC